MKKFAPSLLFLPLLLVSGPAAHAVNIANGDVTGLRNAIIAANTNGQDDTIDLFPGGVYTVTDRAPSSGLNGFPLLGADGGHQLIIHGNGATIQRSGATTFRFFQTNSGANVTLSGLTLTNGNPGAFHGGAIYNNFDETSNATLTIINCTISGNSGDYGGAIFNDGHGSNATLTVMNSTISGNSASQHGGGIWNESGGIVMNVSNCTFSGNSSNGSAGAIQFDGSAGVATGSIINCTFSQNSARSSGGAVNVDGDGGFDDIGNPANGSAILNITNCTFDQNSASHPTATPAKGWGGAIALDGSNASGGGTGNALVKVESCTINNNSAKVLGGGIYLSQTGGGSTTLHIGNTLLETGASGANFAISGGGFISSHGYNLCSDAAGGNGLTTPGGLLDQTGDVRNTDPLLDPAGLKSNGGPTQTIALQSNSPAIDQGNRSTIGVSNNDQRGELRPFNDPLFGAPLGGDSSDVGAYEADVRVISENRVVSDLVLTFMTILGHTYEIQSRPNLLPATPWTTVANSVPMPGFLGTGGIIQVTVPSAIGAGPGFYRLRQF